MPYAVSSTRRGILSHTRETGGTWARSWSIGKIPQHTISALDERKEGKTKPGQSHTIKSSLRYNVCKIYVQSLTISHKFIQTDVFTWKCFVLPGVAETGTFFLSKRALMVELLPTLG